MTESVHSRIIAAEAGKALGSIGFRRRGRSRVWLADHGHWLGVVEFQPSSFSQGTYCNVASHWLWGPQLGLSFDWGLQRIGSFAHADRVDLFTENVSTMANAAAILSNSYSAKLSSLSLIADTLLEQDEKHASGEGGWSAFHRGVASGITGRRKIAQRMFESVLETDRRSLPWLLQRASITEELLKALSNLNEFHVRVQGLVEAQRSFQKLPMYVLPMDFA